jgi:outer membrane protein OmpA-like peptidoglycan-associated protein
MILSGFAALAILTLVCVFRQGPVTEVDLQERARYALDAQGMTWAEISAEGSGLRLTGTAPTEALQAKAADVVWQVRGVREVQNDLVFPEPGAEVFTSPKRDVGGETAGKEGAGLETARRQLLPQDGGGSRDALKSCQVRAIALLSSGKIGFEPAKADISTESHALLDKLLSIVETCPEARIVISGHTDSKGSESSNMELSLNRAQAVVDYLASHGVGSRRLSALGYGENRPIADNATEAGRARNRRIEIAVTTGRIGGG